MPYPNEHACRLREPGEFDPSSMRRMERDHNGKKYSVIIGKLKSGESADQAFRYDRERWDADTARAHCRVHGGEFHAAIGNEKVNAAIRKAAGK